MNFLRKIQNLDNFWKKAILMGIVIAVAVSLGWIVIGGLQKRVEEFKKEEFIKNLNIPDFKKGAIQTPWMEEVKQNSSKLEEELKRLEEMGTSTFPTSTD